MMSMMAGLGWLGMGFMGLWMLLPLAVIVGGVWLVARAAGAGNRGRGADEAATILRRRFASGEINADQYAQARAALGLTGTP